VKRVCVEHVSYILSSGPGRGWTTIPTHRVMVIT
jgi:hypothetical protein